MSNKAPFERFENLAYEDFQVMSNDPTLSPHEKIGFPNTYREGKSDALLHDIFSKVAPSTKLGKIIADIGCGCGELTLTMIEHCVKLQYQLLLVDGEKVLAALPDHPHTLKVAGEFPQLSTNALPAAGCDAVIVYSVLQYVFAKQCVFSFLDAALSLLAPGGHLLLGDIPNASMRRRFLSSEAGKAFHRQYTGRDEDPPVNHQAIKFAELNDAVVFVCLTGTGAHRRI